RGGARAWSGGRKAGGRGDASSPGARPPRSPVPGPPPRPSSGRSSGTSGDSELDEGSSRPMGGAWVSDPAPTTRGERYFFFLVVGCFEVFDFAGGVVGCCAACCCSSLPCSAFRAAGASRVP